ncbi:MAG TPA: SIS domain-containing protein [Anaerolineaceae bacterium]|nr:SIS domain-containing protein [Anaerolineaceae bacterium]
MRDGTFTLQEILTQPQAWTDALEVLNLARANVRAFTPHRYAQILFTGCGSTYYLALSAAALTQQMTGISARAFPASELWLNPDLTYVGGRNLLIAVSRSGESSETLRACQAFLERQRGDLITLSCYPNAPLAGMGMLNLVLPSGQEQSVAQTRAFSTLYLATMALAGEWAGRADLLDVLNRLPEACAQVLEDSAELASTLGQDATLDRFYWLGSGIRYGLACELSLKMKEMSLSHSEPFHFLEFRHGPKSMITDSALVIGLRSTSTGRLEGAVLEDMLALGGRVLDLAFADAPLLPNKTAHHLTLPNLMEEEIRNILYLPVGQRIAFERALSKGLNPDRPAHLDTVVRL